MATLLYQSARYSFYAARPVNAAVLVRRKDNASCYFQPGSVGEAIHAEMCEAFDNGTFDAVCMEYDDILTPRD